MYTINNSSLNNYPCTFPRRLADLAMEYEMELVPSQSDLLSVIVNREDVENIIRRPVSFIGI